MTTSQELLAIGPDLGALELIISKLDNLMIKCLDDQLEEMRELANKIKKRLGSKVKLVNGNGDAKDVELVKELLEKFFILDDYIDKLR